MIKQHQGNPCTECGLPNPNPITECVGRPDPGLVIDMAHAIKGAFNANGNWIPSARMAYERYQEWNKARSASMRHNCKDCKIGVVIKTIKYCGGHDFLFLNEIDITKELDDIYDHVFKMFHASDCTQPLSTPTECSCGVLTVKSKLKNILELLSEVED